MPNKNNENSGENKYLDEGFQHCWVSDINEKAAINFHESLFKLHEDSPSKPIVIHISSYGGDVDALFSMLDTMDAIKAMSMSPVKFLTVVTGKALSAGAVLLSYGDVRFATPMSRIMIHQTIGGSWGSQPANEIEFSEMSRMNAKLLNILRLRCKSPLSAKEFKATLSHNLYLTPEQAMEFGLIDVIGYPKVVEQVGFDVRVLNGIFKKGGNNANRRTDQAATEDKSKDRLVPKSTGKSRKRKSQ